MSAEYSIIGNGVAGTEAAKNIRKRDPLAEGIIPNIMLAKATGILVNKGILVNDLMETNIPNIYAAGDVAEHKCRMYGSWPAAQRQGVVACINMADGNETYMGTVPSTTLKVAGIHLTSMGDISTEDKTIEQVKVKDPEKYIYKKLFIKEGRLVGAIFLGDNKNASELSQLMEKKVDVGRFKEKIMISNLKVLTRGRIINLEWMQPWKI